MLGLAIVVCLASHAGSAFSRFGLGFVFGNGWNVPEGIFRGLPLLAGTLISSALALILALPVALGAALYLSALCPPVRRAQLLLVFQVAATVPSVVYGLWAATVLAPKLLGAERWFATTFAAIPWIGGGTVAPDNVFIAALVLAVMIAPVITVACCEQFAATGGPSGRAIAAAALLGLVRALGETIAVVLVIGDVPAIGAHLFAPGYTLGAAVVNELGEAAGLQRAALFGAGLVLLALALAGSLGARACRPAPAAGHNPAPAVIAGPAVRVLAAVLTAAALLPLAATAYEVLGKGLSQLGAGFFTSDPTNNFFGAVGGMRSALVGSAEIALIATLISVPVGLAVAATLERLGPRSRYAAVVRLGLDLLAGVPPIVTGLFLYATLVLARVDGGYTGWKGALAVALLMVPLIARAPLAAAPAATLSALARGIGVTSPLLFTAGSPNALTLDPGRPMNSLPAQIYADILSPRGDVLGRAWGAALVLVAVVVALNLLGRAAAEHARGAPAMITSGATNVTPEPPNV